MKMCGCYYSIANRDDAVFPDIVAPLDRSETPAPACVEHILMLFYDSIDSQPDCVRIWLEWSVAIRESLRDSYLKFYHAALHGTGEILRERERVVSSFSGQAADPKSSLEALSLTAGQPLDSTRNPDALLARLTHGPQS